MWRTFAVLHILSTHKGSSSALSCLLKTRFTVGNPFTLPHQSKGVPRKSAKHLSFWSLLHKVIMTWLMGKRHRYTQTGTSWVYWAQRYKTAWWASQVAMRRNNSNPKTKSSLPVFLCRADNFSGCLTYIWAALKHTVPSNGTIRGKIHLTFERWIRPEMLNKWMFLCCYCVRTAWNKALQSYSIKSYTHTKILRRNRGCSKTQHKEACLV